MSTSKFFAFALAVLPAAASAASVSFQSPFGAELKIDRDVPVIGGFELEGIPEPGETISGKFTGVFDALSGLSGPSGVTTSLRSKSSPTDSWGTPTAPAPIISGQDYSLPHKVAASDKQMLFALTVCDVAGNCSSLESDKTGGGTAVMAKTWLKVTGVISSTAGESSVRAESGALILANSSKFATKSAVRKNAAEMLRGVSWASPDPSGVILASLAPNGGLIPLKGDAHIGVQEIQDRTTLVVRGDVYIDGNLYDPTNTAIGSSPARVFAIVALSDAEGNGGDIFIGSGVTNVDASLYADRAVHSQGPNQLYIRGSLLSENTIGGSLETPQACPYYDSACAKGADYYDLNKLRTYRPAFSGSVTYHDAGVFAAGGVSCPYDPSTPTPCTSGNLNLAKLFTGTMSDKFSLYATVIRYNPNVLSSPPPLFGK